MHLEYKPQALDYLRSLEVVIRKRIVNKMEFFAAQENPFKSAKHLTDYNVYRFRVGDYRVICDIDRDTITVLLVDKRDNVYKRLQ